MRVLRFLFLIQILAARPGNISGSPPTLRVPSTQTRNAPTGWHAINLVRFCSAGRPATQSRQLRELGQGNSTRLQVLLLTESSRSKGRAVMLSGFGAASSEFLDVITQFAGQG